MPRHLFIINPKAGGEDKTEALSGRIDAYMKVRGLPFYIAHTTHPLHAAELVRDHAADGRSWRVYACGGDGTLNEIAGAAAGLSNVAITQYPCGMGNDFIKIFGEDALRFSELSELVDGTIWPLDLIAVNDRLALNIASVGFDARVAAEMHRYKRRMRISSKKAYDLSVVYNLFRGVHRPYEITIDGEKLPGNRYTLALAANGRYYGGGYNPMPEAVPDDGQLDFLLAGPVSPFGLTRMIGRFSRGLYRDFPETFTYRHGQRMEIACEKPEPVNIDGEIFEAEKVTFSISPLKISFIAPKGAAWTYMKNEKTLDTGRKIEGISQTIR
ncbi:MAG: lipid kinase [Oscillospiraceae bacterium]|nr:lipid kinase [Oscillospiraceae bacterium]